MRAVSNRLARLVVSHPRMVLLSALVVALAALPFGLRLRLATNLVDLVPRSSPGAAAFARYSQAFSAEQSLVILVESSDPARLLEFAARYAAELRRLPGVTRVRERIGPGAAALLRDHLLTLLDDEDLATLATRTTPDALRTQARRLRALIAAPGGAALTPLLVTDPLELLPLISRRLQAGLPVDTTSGYFRSADGQALLLFVQAQHSTFDIETNRQLLAQAAEAARRTGGLLGDVAALASDTAITPLSAPPEPTVWFTGAYAYAVEYRDWLHHDLQLSTLVSAVTVLLSFALFLGAVRVLPLVALPLGLGLWLTAAAAAVLFGQLSAVSLAFGTILLSIGIDVPIQLYNRLREELARLPRSTEADIATRATSQGAQAAVRGAVEHTVARLAGPSLIATLGPALVFACCGLSRYRGLAELGTLAGLGLTLNLLVMLTVLPALLVWLPARWWLPARRPPTEGKTFAWIGRHAARHPRAVLLVTSLVTLAAAPAALRLHYQEQLISVEPAGMQAARVTREVERRMGQRRSMLIALVEHQDREQALAESDRWRAAAEQLRKRGLLVSYQSISNLFPSAAEQARRREALERLGPQRIATDLRAALSEAGFDTAAFEPFLHQLEAPPRPLTLTDAGPDLQFLVARHVQDLSEARLVATYLFPVTERLAEAQAALATVAAAPEGHGAGQLTGFPVLEQTLHELLSRDLLRVTLASVAAVTLLLVLYYREARPVVAVLVPLSLAWVLFAALQGLLDIPLNLFNLLTVPLVVGYGIDDHVFLVQRHRELGTGPAEALGSTGRAIVVTSLSTMAGFAGLIVARFDGLRVLGSSGALAVALCLLAALAMLPALLALLFAPRASRVP